MRSHLTGRCFAVATLAAAILSVVACSQERPGDTYAPGLGEIMTLTQMRHAKLWLAGQVENWPLASYELDELEEGFDDAVEYHPTHKDSRVLIKDVLPAMTAAPIQALRSAVEDKDSTRFAQAFDALTAACNSCHQATDFGFNVVVRPSGNTFRNQDFSLPADLQAGHQE